MGVRVHRRGFLSCDVGQFVPHGPDVSRGPQVENGEMGVEREGRTDDLVVEDGSELARARRCRENPTEGGLGVSDAENMSLSRSKRC